MSDQYGVLAALARQGAVGKTACLAAVVERNGSAPCPVGALMALLDDGQVCGTVGGGRLEQEVLWCLQQVQAQGRAQVRQFRLLPDQTGMPCGGSVTLLLTPVPAQQGELFRRAAEQLQRGEPLILAAHLDSQGQACWYLAATDAAEYAITLQPVPHLVLCGAGHIAQSLAPMAQCAGFRVTVVDDRPAYLAEHPFDAGVTVRAVERFDACLTTLQPGVNSFLLIASYSHQQDKLLLQQALATQAGYIGMVGSKRKREELFSQLRATGVTEQALQRVHCPVGLAIGAQTPAEIAVSILAEMIAVLRHTL